MNLLQSLVRAYDRMAARKEVPSYGYRIRNIDYMISVDVDGTVIGEPISLITTEGKRKLRRALEVPQPLDERTNNPDAPNFLWDMTACCPWFADRRARGLKLLLRNDKRNLSRDRRTCSGARTHPGIKGMGANNGAKLVSFNQQSFESFGRDRQGLNAPVSKPAAYAYTTALGHLASDRRHSVRVGDTDIVFWAEADDPQAAEQAEDIFTALSVEGDKDLTNSYVRDALQKIREGKATARDLSAPFEPVRFFLMGSEVVGDARIATRFYLEDSFGEIAERCLEHLERLRVEPLPEPTALPIWRLLIETVPTRKSYDIAYLFDITNGNPNGDPDAGNLP
jgi:hypothetical protein